MPTENPHEPYTIPEPAHYQMGGPSSIPQTVGRYTIGAELAHGGMGIVYRAHDTAVGRDVAVKVLHERFRGNAHAEARFLAEARITGQLQHPGIPPLFDIGTLPDGSPYLAMKLIKGETLADILTGSETTHDTGWFLPIFEQIAHAVAYAHAHKVIHRDLKPANVMVGAFGEVQVMDWGLAKVLTEGKPKTLGPGDSTLGTEIRSERDVSEETRAGSAMGTPAYMPREQAIGAVDQIDERSDVFGLGGIFCAILTGKPPYAAADSESARQMAAVAELTDAFARLDACDAEPELIALCKRCLCANKADRPKHAGAVAAAVAELRAAADERAKQAELERVRAEVRAAEEANTRKEAEGRAEEQRKRQLEDERAASEKREREARNRDALAAALGRCENALSEGDAEGARPAFAEAEKRSTEDGGEGFTAQVKRCRVDLVMLQELDRIDNHLWTVVGGKLPDPSEIPRRWLQAFTEFGIVPGTTLPADATRLLGESLIRERLLLALDLWLVATPSAALADILGEADPNTYRDAVRAAIHSKNAKQMEQLASQGVAFEQPARFAVALGQNEIIPAERRRAVMERAVFARPGDLTLLMSLAQTYPSDQVAGAAEQTRWLQAAVAAHPRNVAAHYNLGAALHRKGDVDGAIAVWKETTKIDPKLALAHTSLGVALKDKEDVDGAIAAWKEAIKHDSKCAPALYNLGLAQHGKGDVDEAITLWKEAIEHDPNLALAHLNLGVALYGKGDVDGAIAAYQEAIKHNPKLARIHLNLGNALCGKGDVDGGIAAYTEAIKHDPNLAPAHSNLGVALYGKGDVDGAIAAYQEAIKHNPKLAQAHNNLADALNAKGDVGRAIACARAAVAADPQFSTGHATLGDLLQQTGDIPGARVAFTEAARLDKKWAPYLAKLPPVDVAPLPREVKR